MSDCSNDFAATGICQGCGTSTFLMPLHGPKGGPLRCPLCIGKWHAEHGRKRRLGRIVIRAIMAFYDAGGGPKDLDKLKHSAAMAGLLGMVRSEGLGSEITDPLGYMDGVARMDGADADMTSELLADAIKLAHPDHHPPERQELAHRTTQGLVAFQPFVFPAPKPRPSLWERYGSSTGTPAPTERPVRKAPAYPCADCKSAIPYDYCDPCKAEWDKRQAEERKREAAKQRERYARRRATRWWSKVCESCGATFTISGGRAKHKRKDARFCSDACRQKAHRRKAVTDKSSPGRGHLKIRDNAPARSGHEI
jgi:hypothetical protein